ncbi:DUF3850 domain-containing protein [Listeria innocua]|uniref:DUF3850 domain-containing protein n=1 Tax=Listeria TaxID=1637 RepID=UPI001430BD42|nr:DUF3850 domain-containing protein [Listeria innocua]MCD1831401.1 DUF3850 domain-containing protein [Listeria monocytogenes]EIL5148096.1 DUF3850 domain-containing protein [Listeria innocua]EIL5150904.1 DUF3850 domain-containing protein [Listeria innocua]EIL5178669.1 DUF3850 domain-containing protein [Listeria innocua]EIL5207648.1 DUF3850 domain-containing protein [Listeria innocua]
MVHELKINITYFKYVLIGEKTFEIRKNDREYKVGDSIVLNEWNNEKEVYTGRKVSGKIRYITDFMQLPGYVVFSFEIDSK